MYRLTNLFGEPIAIVGVIQAALVMALTFGWLAFIGLDTQGDVALVVVVLTTGSGIYLAFVTSSTLLAPVVEFFKAVLALGAIYGFHMTTEQTGMAIALITAVFALGHRTQTSPLGQGSFRLAA